jgi:hypothetical protein
MDLSCATFSRKKKKDYSANVNLLLSCCWYYKSTTTIGEFKMSMFSNQATPDEFLESAWEDYLASGKPAFDSSDFEVICDDWNIEPWELQDIANDMNETPAPEDFVERN